MTATQLKGRGLDLEAAEETPAQPESARKPWRTPQFLQDRPLTDAGAYDPAAAGEQVMLQGVVDCFWQEADGIVILDFKTDYIDGDLQLKAARYAPQLQAYARALSLIYGLSVRKCILYFFSAGKAVEIDPE